MPYLDLILLPRLVSPAIFAESTVIVVDLLRASTTICTALAAGAACVRPYVEIEDTLSAAARFGRDRVLLGGERGGKLIPGFDLGNSPTEYTPERVAGRRILFTTTNGARAIDHAWRAPRVLVGAAVNRAAVTRAAATDGRDIAILCAGTDGEIADEDRLAGGAMIEGIMRGGVTWGFNDNAGAALDAWMKLGADARVANRPLVDHFALELRNTQGGRNLIAIGQDADLAACAKLDVLDVIPQLRPVTGELRPA